MQRQNNKDSRYISDAVDQAHAADQVVVLRPYQAHRWPGKTYSRAIDGSIVKEQLRIGVWFKPITHAVTDLDSLHHAFVSAIEAKDGAAGFAVRGALINPKAKSCTRGKVSRPKKPAGIKDVAQHWMLLDVDGLPNVLKIDPRKEPGRALAWVRSLLPNAFNDVRMSWQWSSSSCIGLADDKAPEDLRLHFRVMIDQAMGEKECGEVLKRVDRFVKDRLQIYGLSLPHAKKIVDPRVAVANQPLYVIRPKLTGVVDPYPGEDRYGITLGTREIVLLSDLEMELPTMAEIDAQLRAERKLARIAQRQHRPVEASGVARERDQGDGTVSPPKRKLGRVLEAFYAARQQIISNKLQVSYERRLMDIVALIHARREQQVPGWERGLPEGRRAILFHIVASLIALISRSKDNLFTRMDMGGWPFRKLTDAFAAELMDDLSWYRDEWLAGGFDSSIRDKVVQEMAGLRCPWGDRERTPIYEYSIPRILSEFEVTEGEMITLGLKALISKAVKSYNARQAKGALSREEYLAQVQTGSIEAQEPWIEMGISRSTYYARKAAQNGAFSSVLRGWTGFETGLEREKREKGGSEGQMLSTASGTPVVAVEQVDPVFQQEVPVLVAADTVPFDVTLVPVPVGMVMDPEVEEVTATTGWIPIDHPRAREGLRWMKMREHIMPPPKAVAA